MTPESPGLGCRGDRVHRGPTQRGLPLGSLPVGSSPGCRHCWTGGEAGVRARQGDPGNSPAPHCCRFAPSCLRTSAERPRQCYFSLKKSFLPEIDLKERLRARPADAEAGRAPLAWGPWAGTGRRPRCPQCPRPCLQLLAVLFFFSLMGLVSSHLNPHVSQPSLWAGVQVLEITGPTPCGPPESGWGSGTPS